MKSFRYNKLEFCKYDTKYLQKSQNRLKLIENISEYVISYVSVPQFDILSEIKIFEWNYAGLLVYCRLIILEWYEGTDVKTLSMVCFPVVNAIVFLNWRQITSIIIGVLNTTHWYIFVPLNVVWSNVKYCCISMYSSAFAGGLILFAGSIWCSIVRVFVCWTVYLLDKYILE